MSQTYITGSIIGASAALRGQGRFDEAIALVEAHLAEGKSDPDYWINLHLEVFYAAVEAGDTTRATRYALLLHQRDPELPSIQRFLPLHKRANRPATH